MQELYPSYLPAELKSVAKIKDALQFNNGIPDAIRQEIIDEEKTHAVEVLTLVTKRGCVPREYYFNGDELIDQFGYSIGNVISSGIDDAERKAKIGMPGAEKELRRRQIERDNFRSYITSLPVGRSCIEWSPTDYLWSEEERITQGYCGNTLARVTSRVDDTKFLQFNIILPHSDLGVINNCRRLIDCNVETIDNAEEILANPQIVDTNLDSPYDMVGYIESEFSRALLATHTATAVTKMLWLVVKRRDAKGYVFAQNDVFDAMIDSYIAIAGSSRDLWRESVNAVRGGAWQLLIERYKGKEKKTGTTVATSSIKDAANRAALAGAIFSACGGTIDMGGMAKISGASLIERAVTVMSLLSQENGIGRCSSCGRMDTLYGCGIFCQHCNEIWCDEYLRTGEQLEPQQILLTLYLYYSRGARSNL